MENVVEYLQGKWMQLTDFNKKEELKNKLWNELTSLYNQRNRHYHNLSHLGNLFHLFESHIDLAENPAVICFAIFYHDVVYDTMRSDNEEQSALKAKDHLQQLKVKASLIDNVTSIIIATKEHIVDPFSPVRKDMALFLDLDLAVLAEDWKDYEVYRQNIRKEFNQYTDLVYKSGRLNALRQILNKEFIYYSPGFQNSLEVKARQNLNREISLL